MGNGPDKPEAYWLQQYLLKSVRKNLCVRINCTTCGSREFRQGLLVAVGQETGRLDLERIDDQAAAVITRGLAVLQPEGESVAELESAVRLILFLVWNSVGEFSTGRGFLEPILAGSWAGSVLDRMKAHHQQRMEERRVRHEYESPERVQQRREKKRCLRQEKHIERLKEKKERDRLWKEKQQNSS